MRQPRRLTGLAALAVLAGCGAAVPVHPVISADAAGDGAGVDIHEDDLPAAAKQDYEYARLAVADVKTATTYTIKDGRGVAISENEFARRYGEATGSSELVAYDRARRRGTFALGIGLVAGGVVGIPLLVDGIVNRCSSNGTGPHCTSSGESPLGDVVVMSAGLLLVTNAALGGSAALYEGVTWHDGRPDTDHFLSEGDARLLVDRYNRALLRRGLQGVPKVAVRPVVSPGFTGVVGQF